MVDHSRWPADVDGCVRCGAEKFSVSYGQRGLCMRCLRIVKAEGKLRSYRRGVPGGKPYDKLPGDLGWLIHHIGLTQVAEALGASKEVVLNWLERGLVDVDVTGKMKGLLDRVKYLTRQAKRGKRWEPIKTEKIKKIDPWEGYRKESILPLPEE